MNNVSKTPLTDEFVAKLPPVEISDDLVATGQSVRQLMCAWREHADEIEEGLHRAMALCTEATQLLDRAKELVTEGNRITGDAHAIANEAMDMLRRARNGTH